MSHMAVASAFSSMPLMPKDSYSLATCRKIRFIMPSVSRMTLALLQQCTVVRPVALAYSKAARMMRSQPTSEKTRQEVATLPIFLNRSMPLCSS